MTEKRRALSAQSPETDLTCQQVTALLVDYVAEDMAPPTRTAFEAVSAIARIVLPFWRPTRRPSTCYEAIPAELLARVQRFLRRKMEEKRHITVEQNAEPPRPAAGESRVSLFPGRQKASVLTIPWCTYTDPQIAHVGITEHQAAAVGMAITTFTQPLDDVDRAIPDGETEGFAKVHVQKGTDKILGATVVARNAGDMIGMYTMAMMHSLGLGALAKVIQPYPTQAEAIRKTGDLYNRTRLTPRVKQLMLAWMRWRRRH